ncbi:hypothetical protein MUSASHINO07_04230 [Gemella sp. Musashino-2025]
MKNRLYVIMFYSKIQFDNMTIGHIQTVLINDTHILATGVYNLFWSLFLNILLFVSYLVILF